MQALCYRYRTMDIISNSNCKSVFGAIFWNSKRCVRTWLAVSILCTAILCLIGPSLTTAATINLAWDPIISQPAGYRVFLRTGNAAYNYSTPVWQGTPTTCAIQRELQAGQTYYFVARAFSGTQESVNSNEISYAVPLAPVDTDGDGLSDRQEIDVYGTDPNRADTDGDGVADGAEIAAGTDPLTAPPPAEEPRRIWIEAENGDITTPMIIMDNPSASLEGCVCVPNGSTSSGGEVIYRFNIAQTGEYIVWARVIAPSEADNSFFISMDGQTQFSWSTIVGANWLWDKVGIPGKDPMVFRFQAGAHTLKFVQREDGTHLDRLLITNDQTYIPQGLGEPANQTPQPLALTHVELEAEAGAVSAPMRVVAQSNASGGAYVGVPQGGGTISAPSNSAGVAAYEFNLAERGNYRVWGRVIAPSGADDSFFTAMDGGSFERWNTQQGSTWHWDLVAAAGGADPRIYTLDAGSHTFYLMQREDGTFIDKLIITLNPNFIPQ